MTIYFSSKNIPKLSSHSLAEREEFINKAELNFTAPEKLILNLLKLGMLTPPFLFLARQEWGYFTMALLLTLLVKQFIFNPIKLAFCNKYLTNR